MSDGEASYWRKKVMDLIDEHEKLEADNHALADRLLAAEKERDINHAASEFFRKQRRDFTLTKVLVGDCFYVVDNHRNMFRMGDEGHAYNIERWSRETAKVEETNVIHPGLRNPEGASSPEPAKRVGWMMSSSPEPLVGQDEPPCPSCGFRFGTHHATLCTAKQPAPKVEVQHEASCGCIAREQGLHSEATCSMSKPPALDLAASWVPFDRLKAALNEWKRLDNTHSLAEAIRQLILAIVNDEITITKPPAPDLATLRERVMRSFRFMASEEQIDALRDYFLACVDAKENKS